MEDRGTDLSRDLTLDANAVAGLLQEIFGVDMTAAPTECASCGNDGDIGELLAFTEGPGVILRCAACENVVLRVVQTPTATYLDARGAVYLRLAHPPG